MRLKRIFGVFLGLLGAVQIGFAACDPSTPPVVTPRIGLLEPVINACGWGVTMNNNMSILDTNTILLGAPNTFTADQTYTGNIFVSTLNVTNNAIINGQTIVKSIRFPDGTVQVSSGATTANVIQNTSSLQSGAVFYVSSGAATGPLTAPIVNASTLQINGVNFLSDGGNASGIFLGDTSAPSNSLGLDNICIGQQTCNTFTSANSDMVIIGNRAGRNLIAGNSDTCIGSQACGGLDTTGAGIKNIAVGANALSALGIGQKNVGTGWSAGGSVTTGNDNDLYGDSAGNNIVGGTANALYGSNSGINISGGVKNSCFGFNNCLNIKLGSSNTVVGATAGHSQDNNGADSGSTYIGFGAGPSPFLSNTPLFDAIAIGNNAVVVSSNTAQIGGPGVDAVRVIMSTFTASSGTVAGPFSVTGPLSITGPTSLNGNATFNNQIAAVFFNALQDGSSQINNDGGSGKQRLKITAQDGVIAQGNLISSGTTPSLGSCGTTPTISTAATNNAGNITWGGAATTCVLTFANGGYIAPPFCVANTASSSGFAEPTTTTNTGVTFTFSASITGSTMTYVCIGGRGG